MRIKPRINHKNTPTIEIIGKSIICSALISALLLNSGCANTAEGAGTGALAGAAGGLVSGLIWGGDPLESAARGAAVGAASGAAVGAVQDAKQSSATKQASETEAKQQQANQPPSDEELRGLIGEPAFNGITALAKCDYASALELASQAKNSPNTSHQEAGTWIQALSYAETGDVEKLNNSYAEIIKRDKKVSNVLEAQSSLSEALDKLKTIRKDHQLPESCS